MSTARASSAYTRVSIMSMPPAEDRAYSSRVCTSGLPYRSATFSTAAVPASVLTPRPRRATATRVSASWVRCGDQAARVMT